MSAPVCRDCGASAGRAAVACPRCGTPLSGGAVARRSTLGHGSLATVAVAAGGACLLLLLVGSRITIAERQIEQDEILFVEQIGNALDALQGRCAESRHELSLAVLELQHVRRERGQPGSALDILHGIRASLDESADRQNCVAVARHLVGAV